MERYAATCFFVTADQLSRIGVDVCTGRLTTFWKTLLSESRQFTARRPIDGESFLTLMDYLASEKGINFDCRYLVDRYWEALTFETLTRSGVNIVACMGPQDGHALITNLKKQSVSPSVLRQAADSYGLKWKEVGTAWNDSLEFLMDVARAIAADDDGFALLLCCQENRKGVKYRI